MNENYQPQQQQQFSSSGSKYKFQRGEQSMQESSQDNSPDGMVKSGLAGLDNDDWIQNNMMHDNSQPQQQQQSGSSGSEQQFQRKEHRHQQIDRNDDDLSVVNCQDYHLVSEKTIALMEGNCSLQELARRLEG